MDPQCRCGRGIFLQCRLACRRAARLYQGTRLKMMELDGIFVLMPMTSTVPELAHKIE
jgi:hypothetical protein